MKNLILIALLAITTNILADSEHNTTTNISETIIEKSITIVESNSVALPMAIGMHQFDYGSYAVQKSVTAAWEEESVAVSAAMAYRDCITCGLSSIAVAIEDNSDETKIGVAVGYTWN